MVKFSHSNPTVGDLILRLDPTQIDWTYNLNTNKIQTYGGEVIQILSMNIDKLTIVGRFGKEGPHGKTFNKDRNEWVERNPSEFSDYKDSGALSTGLTQMTEYFRRYFSIASQGRDSTAHGNFNQDPMTLVYGGSLQELIDEGTPEGPWIVYPINFPSYRRSNLDFAPEWKVEFQVVEPPSEITSTIIADEIDKLYSTTKTGIGYSPFNKFSDPLGGILEDQFPNFATLSPVEKAKAVDKAALILNNQIGVVLDHYNDLLPAYNNEDLDALIFGSIPNYQLTTDGRGNPLPQDSTPGGKGGV